jgi:hypothetical protein
MSQPIIKLNFINHSNDASNSQVVVFQKNSVLSANATAIAWKVITNCGRGSSHSFEYPPTYAVAIRDSWGNVTAKLKAKPCDVFKVIQTPSGVQLVPGGNGGAGGEIDIQNDLAKGAIDAWIYKDGSKLGGLRNVVPGQMATFSFMPAIWIGVFSQVNEGQVMNAAMLSQVNTEISLLGIASADIVMTGGGEGSKAQPFTFTLTNVVMA